MRTCNQSPPGTFLLAIRQFNAREWYECHETIEQLWLHETGELRSFLQGMLQIAVALNHWRNANHPGAVRLLASGVGYLRQAPAVCFWVDVAALIAASERLQQELETLGPDRMDTLDPSHIPQIVTVSTTDS